MNCLETRLHCEPKTQYCNPETGECNPKLKDGDPCNNDDDCEVAHHCDDGFGGIGEGVCKDGSDFFGEIIKTRA